MKNSQRRQQEVLSASESRAGTALLNSGRRVQTPAGTEYRYNVRVSGIGTLNAVPSTVQLSGVRTAAVTLVKQDGRWVIQGGAGIGRYVEPGVVVDRGDGALPPADVTVIERPETGVVKGPPGPAGPAGPAPSTAVLTSLLKASVTEEMLSASLRSTLSALPDLLARQDDLDIRFGHTFAAADSALRAVNALNQTNLTAQGVAAKANQVTLDAQATKERAESAAEKAAQAAGAAADSLQYKADAESAASSASGKATAAAESAQAALSHADDASQSASVASGERLKAEAASGAASGSAAAAAEYERQAGAFSDAAGQSAFAASQSEIAASASKDSASGSAQSALKSAQTATAASTDAERSASAAETSRISAETAFNDAGRARDAALNSANAASESERNASGYSNAAESAAAAARTDALSAKSTFHETQRLGGNLDFRLGFVDWSESSEGVLTAADTFPGKQGIRIENGVLVLEEDAALYAMTPIPVYPGHKYRSDFWWRVASVVGSGASIELGVVFLNDGLWEVGNSLEISWATAIPTSWGSQELMYDFEGDFEWTMPFETRFVRPFVRLMNVVPGTRIEIDRMLFSDVTQAFSAFQSAEASASSAQTASTQADAAKASADAARQSELNAASEFGKAKDEAGKAASSASAANTSAGTASSEAGKAASSAGAANQSALDASSAKDAASSAAGIAETAAAYSETKKQEIIRLGGNGDFEEGLINWAIIGGSAGRLLPLATESEAFKVVQGLGKSGGAALRVRGERWVFAQLAIPINTSRQYRIRIRVKQTVETSAGSSSIFTGFAPLDANYNDLFGGAGTFRYATVGQPIKVADGWRDFEGVITGEGDDNFQFRPGTAYARLMFIVNYGAGTSGEALVDFIEVEDVTELKMAESSAAAAKSSELAANSSQENSAKSAESASKSAETATSKANEASGSASAARTSEINAGASAGRASDSAKAASTSAETASAKATDAINAAGAAAQSLLETNSAKDAANSAAQIAEQSAVYSDAQRATMVRLGGNGDFEEGLINWTTGMTGLLPDTIDPGMKVVTGQGRSGGAVLEMVGQLRAVQQRAIPVDLNKIYQLRTRVRQLEDSAGVLYAGVILLDANYNTVGGTYRDVAAAYVSLKASAGWQEYEGSITGNGPDHHHSFSPDTAYVRPFIAVNWNAGAGAGRTQVDFLEFEEVTALKHAESSAAAAQKSSLAASASSDKATQDAGTARQQADAAIEKARQASASATAAGASAEASEQNRIRAETAEGKALSYRDESARNKDGAIEASQQAGTSARNAAGSAEAASGSESRAKGSETTAKAWMQASAMTSAAAFQPRQTFYGGVDLTTGYGIASTGFQRWFRVETKPAQVGDQPLLYSTLTPQIVTGVQARIRITKSSGTAPNFGMILFGPKGWDGWIGIDAKLPGGQLVRDHFVYDEWVTVTWDFRGASNDKFNPAYENTHAFQFYPAFWQNYDQLFEIDWIAVGVMDAVPSTSKAEFKALADNLAAEATIKVQYGNVIAGIGARADANGSAVGVMADRFFVAQPGYTDKYPFTVRDGQIQIDGNLVAKGTISAQKLNIGGRTDSLVVRGTGLNRNMNRLLKLNDTVIYDQTNARGLRFTAFRIGDGTLTKGIDENWDVWEGEWYQNQLADRLDSHGADWLIVLTSWDAIKINGRLAEAINNAGGNVRPGISGRFPYALVTRGYAKKGNGVQVMTDEFDTASPAEINTLLINGIPTSMGGGFGRNTIIDGDQITTGTINAQRLDLSGVLKVGTALSALEGNLDKSRLTGDLSDRVTVIDGGKITTGTINAARLDLSGVLKVGGTNFGDIGGSLDTTRVTGNLPTSRINGLDSSISGINADIGGIKSNVYTPGTTEINGGRITTGSIAADRLDVRARNLVVDPNLTGTLKGWQSNAFTLASFGGNGQTAALVQETNHWLEGGSDRFEISPKRGYQFNVGLYMGAANYDAAQKGARYFGLMVYNRAGQAVELDEYRVSDRSYIGKTTNPYFWAGKGVYDATINLSGLLLPAGTDPKTVQVPSETTSFFLMPTDACAALMRMLNVYGDQSTVTRAVWLNPSVTEIGATTKIVGENITTGRIQASNGSSFLNLNDGSMRMGAAGGNRMEYSPGGGLSIIGAGIRAGRLDSSNGTSYIDLNDGRARLGQPGGNRIEWDGSKLIVQGNLHGIDSKFMGVSEAGQFLIRREPDKDLTQNQKDTKLYGMTSAGTVNGVHLIEPGQTVGTGADFLKFSVPVPTFSYRKVYVQGTMNFAVRTADGGGVGAYTLRLTSTRYSGPTTTSGGGVISGSDTVFTFYTFSAGAWLDQMLVVPFSFWTYGNMQKGDVDEVDVRVGLHDVQYNAKQVISSLWTPPTFNFVRIVAE